MKTLFVLLLLASAPALAQDYKIFVEREAVPARGYGAPLFNRPDSTGRVALMVPGGKKCFVISQDGAWYRVKYDSSTIYYAVASSLLLPGSVGHEIAQPVNGTNAVIVFTADSPAEAWTKACQTLLSKGFALAQREADLHTFSTAPRAIGRNMQLTITGYALPAADGKGSTVTLSGSYSYLAAVATGIYGVNTATGTRPAAVTNGLNQGPDHSAFAMMDQVAHAYQGGTVKYGTR